MSKGTTTAYFVVCDAQTSPDCRDTGEIHLGETAAYDWARDAGWEFDAITATCPACLDDQADQ